jgi:NADH-quinone oxidoreductase subunit N
MKSLVVNTSFIYQTYYSIGLYLIIAAALCIILALVAYLASLSSIQEGEKRSEYECGFEPFDSATRLPFDVHFYLVGILFLVFDVEIALLFPWVLGVQSLGWPGFYSMVGFILVLAVGFIYEWRRGALIWPSSQQDSPYNNIHPFILVNTFSMLCPEMFLAFSLFLTLIYLSVMLRRGTSKKVLALDSAEALRTSLWCAALMYCMQLTFPFSLTALHGYALNTTLAIFIKLLVLISGGLILWSSERFMRAHQRHMLEYPFTFVLSLLFMLLLVSSNHLIAAFISIVGFSLGLYVLVLSDAPTAIAREAGIKYFYLSTASSGLTIYGIFLLFVSTGTCNFIELGTTLYLAVENVAAAKDLLALAFLLLFTGLCFKLSAYPGHLWAPDVYEGAPDPITALFMLPVKVAVFGFVVNLVMLALEPVAVLWQPMMALSAALSLVWGCLCAAVETKTKRFLAYTSINQMGFLLLGLSTLTLEGYRATVLYLALYALMNIGFLLLFLHCGHHFGASAFKYLTDFRSLGQMYPVYGWVLATVMFSMAGIPPLAGFFGKYYLLLHAQQQGLYGLVIVGLLTSLISTYYYLRLIKIMFFEGSQALRPSWFYMWRDWQPCILAIVTSLLWGFILFSRDVNVIFDKLILDVFLVYS